MFKTRLFYILPFLFLLTHCTLDGFNTDELDVLTEDVLENASLILGDVISEDSNGIFLSVQDAIAIVAGQGIQPKEKSTTQNDTKEKFDYISDYKAWYEKDTGKHIIMFNRFSYNNRSQEKDSLNYIYQDKDGDFIIYPQEQENEIESIRYSGFKEGLIDKTQYDTMREYVFEPTIYQQTQYSQKSDFLIYYDLNDRQQPKIEGLHTEKGRILSMSEKEETKQTNYEFKMDFLDLRLNIKKRFDEDELAGVRQESSDVQVDIDHRRRKGYVDFIGITEWEMISTEGREQEDNRTKLSGSMIYEGNGLVIVKFDNSDQTIILDAKTGVNVNDINTKEERATFE